MSRRGSVRRIGAALALVLLAAAPALAEPQPLVPPWTGGEPAFPGVPDAEAAIFEAVNEARTSRGLAALQEHPHLRFAARQHVQTMRQLGFWGHDQPGDMGRKPYHRAWLAGYLAMASENIIRGWDKPTSQALAADLVDGWLKSPGHRANMLDPKWRELGVGVNLHEKVILGATVFGPGQPFVMEAFTWEATKKGYALRLRLRPTEAQPYERVRLQVGGRDVGDWLPVKAGEALDFAFPVPRGARTTVGFLGVKERATGAMWPNDLWDVDTREEEPRLRLPRSLGDGDAAA